jgi:hypothetical protein
MGGMSSLTGGGGASNSSSSSSATGDQGTGNFTIGAFNAGGSPSGSPSQQMLIAGGLLVLVGSVYVLSKKKR